MQRVLKLISLAAFFVITLALFLSPSRRFSPLPAVEAQVSSTPAAFDQTATLAKLREQLKGKEREPAETVFKNIQLPMFKGSPASRVLAVMEMGFSRSLGVNCTHCHVPEKWESEEKQQKQIARDMATMMTRINGELLKSVKNLKSEQPTINCTTCHRGEIKPALNMPR